MNGGAAISQVAPVAEKKAAPPPVTVAPAKPAAAPGGAWAKLAEKYGAEKTAAAKKIAADMGDLVNEGMELAKVAAANSGAATIAEAAGKEAVKGLATQLGLDEAQQQKVASLAEASVNEKMGVVSELASAMQSDPEPMMELFLAGDALSRKEITQEQYDQITQPTRTMLQNIGGLVMGRPGGGGPGSQMLRDDQFTKQLSAILTPEQQAKLTELTTQATQPAQTGAGRGLGGGLAFANGTVPVMELEKLGQSVDSVKKLAGAARQMMDAMKGLKDANTPPPAVGN